MAVAAAMALAGCAAMTPPPRFGAASPADPAAAESPLPAPSPSLLAQPDTASAPAVGGHEAPGAHSHGVPAAEDAYTCTMHPEVRSATPGACPKCGMPLVPRSAVKPKEERP